MTRKITVVLLLIYLAVLVWVLILKLGVEFSYMETRSVNFTPFRELIAFGFKSDILEILLNVLIFIPMGLYSGALFKNWVLIKHALVFLVISLFIESLQYVLAIGAFDITDLITNTFGGVLGWLLYKMIKKIVSSQVKAQKVINALAGIGTFAVLLILVLLKLDLLPIKYR
jgi:glycopeptide antibiotics resistance protein